MTLDQAIVNTPVRLTQSWMGLQEGRQGKIAERCGTTTVVSWDDDGTEDDFDEREIALLEVL